MRNGKRYIIKTFCFITLMIITIFLMTTCDNGNDDNADNSSGGGDNNYIEGTYSGLTVKSTSSGQVTFMVHLVTANFTTNIPNNNRFTLDQNSTIKTISGLTPNNTYQFSFTYNANIIISCTNNNGTVFVQRWIP